MKFIGRLALLLTSTMAAIAAAQSPANQTYTNPVIPGWHSDPSCIRTPDGIFLCVASTFVAFPGLPIYASRNLVDWKLVSHVWSRESQLPGISWSTFNQMGGMYAATIRMHEGTYYVACEYLNAESVNEVLLGVLFKTTDPFSDEAWSDPVLFYPTGSTLICSGMTMARFMPPRRASSSRNSTSRRASSASLPSNSGTAPVVSGPRVPTFTRETAGTTS